MDFFKNFSLILTEPVSKFGLNVMKKEVKHNTQYNLKYPSDGEVSAFTFTFILKFKVWGAETKEK